jgi:hypothetical protein
MNAFQWLLVLGFPPDVAASSVMPRVFAAEDNVTANDLLTIPKRRESPVCTAMLLPAAA